jgi:very-short-patch-repair endonuclease
MRASQLSPELQRKIFGEVVDKPKRDPKDEAEKLFAFQCRAKRMPLFRKEHRFAESVGRGYRFDFAWPEYFCALEIEGLVMRRVNGELVVGGRHVNPNGFREDCRKYALAATMGWHVLRFEQSQVMNGEAVDFAEQLLRRKGWVS